MPLRYAAEMKRKSTLGYPMRVRYNQHGLGHIRLSISTKANPGASLSVVLHGSDLEQMLAAADAEEVFDAAPR